MVRIRTKREIELITASCQIVSDTLDMLSEHVKPGVKIIDLDKIAEKLSQLYFSIVKRASSNTFRSGWLAGIKYKAFCQNFSANIISP